MCWNRENTLFEILIMVFERDCWLVSYKGNLATDINAIQFTSVMVKVKYASA